MKKLIRAVAAFVVATSMLAAAGCANPNGQNKTVTIATHDSFVMSKELIAQFEKKTGYKLEIAKMGDAGELTNKLVITKDTPVADAFFGIDNTFSGVAKKNQIVDGSMTAIDYADVCFNYDIAWFKHHGLAAPSTWQELTNSKYRGLTVVENPATSSTGLAFLFATVAQLGVMKLPDGSAVGWKVWWKQLAENGLKVDAGWEQAYYTDFSGSSGKGDYPIVLSYSSSPADEVNSDGTPRTASISKDCFRQTEYAGVLAHASNPTGARALIDFMLGKDFQASLPESMYVYPVNITVNVPARWSDIAKPADTFVDTSKLNFDKYRTKWIDEWTSIVMARA